MTIAPPRSNPTLELELAGGLRVAVPDNLNLMTSYVLLEQEGWFEDEIGFVGKLVGPGKAAIDVGANFGLYSLVLARAVGPTGKVWSFEPAAGTARFLQESIHRNGFAHVHLVRAALSDHEGDGLLSMAASPELNHLQSDPAAGGERVPVSTLDAQEALWADHPIDFLKIDAEGSEAAILRGGSRFFRQRSPVVMFEVKHGKGHDHQLLDLFVALGHELFRLVPGLGALEPLDRTAPLDPFQLNVFACKPDRRDDLASRGLLVRRDDQPGRREAGWSALTRSQPWARSLALSWNSWAARELGEAPALYRQVLIDWAAARDGARPKPARLADLRRAWSSINRLLELAPANAARLLTRARLAGDLGYRASQVQDLQRVAQALAAEPGTVPKEPFLAASERFDAVDPRKHFGDWLAVSVLETLERRASFSSFFQPQVSLDLLGGVANRRFCHPETKRRLALIALRRSGGCPPAFADLKKASPENRNAAFWASRLAA